MQLRYFKMLGAGNRILVVDQRDDNLPPPSASQLRRLASDSSGPGFDQLMWVGPPRAASAAASYRVFNADGSEVEQCGNGARCVVAMLAREDDSQQSFTLESPAGLIEATLVDNENVAVNMGPPEFDPTRVPFVAAGRQDSYQIEVAGQTVVASVLSMGNPHCVIQVDDIATAAVGELGPALENHARFPAAANIGFMCVRDRENIDLRVHERGVGETLACGTGACAAVVAGQQSGQLGERVAVQLPGGQLMVSWRGGAEPVWLTGNAELIGEGTIDL
jgi:diaminopimelate epimerase